MQGKARCTVISKKVICFQLIVNFNLTPLPIFNKSRLIIMILIIGVHCNTIKFVGEWPCRRS